MLTFEAVPYVLDKWTIVHLPEDISTQLPSRGQVSIKGTINNHDVAIVLEPDGRWGHWFKLDAILQKTTGAKAGDTVKIAIEPSKEWPEPNLPEDFSEALVHAPIVVKELWKKITPMARWEWIRWVNATSVTETRERRVQVSISKLHSGKRRPCCFNLAACTDPDLTKNGKLIEPAQKAA